MVCLQLVLLYRKYQAIERAQIDGILINYVSMQKTPEEWLDTAEGQKRGRFKVFLGYAPGVGKTFSMLSEAVRRKASAPSPRG